MSEQYPKAIVGMFIFNKENKLLVFKTHKWKGNWGIPGGHIEFDETIEEAIRRETKEETGLEVYDIKFVTVLENVNTDEFYKKGHYIFLNYKCRTDGNSVTLNDEAQEYRWVTLNEALQLSLNSYTRTTIDLLKKQSE